MSTVYSNPIESETVREVGEQFYIRTNPKLPKLLPGDFVNLHLENARYPYGRATVIEYTGATTYYVRRTE